MTDKKPIATVFCSFCGKNQNEVAILIAGGGAHICEECVNRCVEICLKKMHDQNCTKREEKTT